MADESYLNPEDSSEFPPSYTEATSSSSPVPSYTSHLSSHLASLPSVIRNNKDSHLAHLAAQDADLLSLINPEIDALIGALVSRHPSSRPPPASATLVLVPAAAVPQGAKYVHDDHGGDAITRVARVSDPKGLLADGISSKAEKEYSWSTSRTGESSVAREFSDWGRWDDDDSGASERDQGKQWWWKDEDMATRLAGHLQPKDQVVVDRRSVREAVEAQKQEKRAAGVLGRLRSPQSSGSSSSGAQQGMTVVAEEVTFRRENEMGIWESMSGWAIIVRLNVKAL